MDATRFSPMRIAFRAARGFEAVILLISVIVVTGHLTGATLVYRPLPEGPATHPLTVIMTAWIAVGLLLVSPIRPVSGAARLVFLFVAAFASVRLIEMIVVMPSEAVLGTTFNELPKPEAHGTTGANTLVTGLLIAGGQLLRSRRPTVALVVAALAPLLPLIASFGYAFGLPPLYGDMSPVTLALLLPLSLAGMTSFVRRQALRPLFADTYFGRSARVEFLAGLGFPLAIGALIAQRDPAGAGDTAVQAALMALFAATVVLVKTRGHAATEQQRRRSVQALKAAAVTDHLTGLTNRHGANARIEALSATWPVGVILADIDNFKQVNDVWGHAAGDRVLVDVARVLRDRVGTGGLVARWGGEEFLLVLPRHDLEASLAIAEELRAEVARLYGPGGGRGEITASFGVSERFPRESSLDGAMFRADTALYNAKDTGRDKVVRDGCAGCSGVKTAAFVRERLLSDKGAMDCDCAIGDRQRRGSVSTVSAPVPGSLN